MKAKAIVSAPTLPVSIATMMMILADMLSVLVASNDRPTVPNADIDSNIIGNRPALLLNKIRKAKLGIVIKAIVIIAMAFLPTASGILRLKI